MCIRDSYTSPSHSLSRSPSKTPKLEASKPLSVISSQAQNVKQEGKENAAPKEGTGGFELTENTGLVRLKKELASKMAQADLATQRLTARRARGTE